MISSPVQALLFFVFAALAVAGGCLVAFARNIVHGGFALLATFVGVAGLYAFLSADFLAVVQVMIYVGGVLILILFALMLTSRIDEARVSNPTIGTLPAVFLLIAFSSLLVYAGVTEFGGTTALPTGEPTTEGIGDALLSRFVLPFEVISVLLLAALLGAVTIAGGRLRKPGAGKEPS
jgi:NADH-quinone oxidoreductase subunit J